MVTLTAKQHPLVQQFLADPALLNQAKRFHDGPVHVIFPQVYEENLQRFKDLFVKHDVDLKLAVALKPNKSVAFLRQAFAAGVDVDVASAGELSRALAAGFTGDRISCTGAKNDEFLMMSISHKCLISVDSLTELNQIVSLEKKIGVSGTRVLLRISDPVSKDRNLKIKTSRFGISRKVLAEAYDIIKSSESLKLEGLHFHNYEPREAKAGFVEDFLSLIEEAYAQGFSPQIIDIGGGFRTQMLEDYSQWSLFIEELSDALLHGKDTNTWRGYSYELFLNDKGKISGREKFIGQFVNQDYETMIEGILENSSLRGRPLKTFLQEAMFSIMIEPGAAACHQAGFSVFRVNGTKRAVNGKELILVDGNMYNISVYMVEPLLDPILVPRQKEDGSAEEFSGYLVGNLCKEGDVLMKRAVQFSQKPKNGDLLVFPNTAAYASDFEDTNPQLHPAGIKVVAHRTEDKEWELYADHAYQPLLKKAYDL